MFVVAIREEDEPVGNGCAKVHHYAEITCEKCGQTWTAYAGTHTESIADMKIGEPFTGERCMGSAWIALRRIAEHQC